MYNVYNDEYMYNYKRLHTFRHKKNPLDHKQSKGFFIKILI